MAAAYTMLTDVAQRAGHYGITEIGRTPNSSQPSANAKIDSRTMSLHPVNMNQ